jgi:hypothetical protein
LLLAHPSTVHDPGLKPPLTRCDRVGLSGLEPLTSALSERPGLLRGRLGGAESPVLSVKKPCGLLHSLSVLWRLVSPARPLPTASLSVPHLTTRAMVAADLSSSVHPCVPGRAAEGSQCVHRQSVRRGQATSCAAVARMLPCNAWNQVRHVTL